MPTRAVRKKWSEFTLLCWSIPIFLTIHNFEEFLTMPEWMNVHLSLLRMKFFVFRSVSFSPEQLYLSLILVTVVPWVFSLYCLTGIWSKKKLWMMLILQSIIGWNAVVPHISGTLILGMYNPGLVTALLINLPFTIYLFYRSVADGFLVGGEVRKILFIGIILYVPLVYLNHLIATYLAMLT